MKKYINEYGEKIVQITLDELGTITDEERELVRNARKSEVVLDDPDCPPMSEDMHRHVQNIITEKKRLNIG